MALSDNSLPYGLRDIKLTPYTDAAGTILASVSIDLPIARTLGFTDTEEEAVGLTHIVPFLVEDELKRLGGIFSKLDDWQPYVLIDGQLITGQNPASSGPAAKLLLEQLVPADA